MFCVCKQDFVPEYFVYESSVSQEELRYVLNEPTDQTLLLRMPSVVSVYLPQERLYGTAAVRSSIFKRHEGSRPT